MNSISDLTKSYVNAITAASFGEFHVNDPRIPITVAGWYWADRTDNARYSDWHGPYDSMDEALEAGRAYRLENVNSWTKEGILKQASY